MAESQGLPYEHANGTVQLTDDLAIDTAIVKYGSWIKTVSFYILVIFVLLLIKCLERRFEMHWKSYCRRCEYYLLLTAFLFS